jgi:acetyltransferase-like isoleucine patch superfamily enzyme
MKSCGDRVSLPVNMMCNWSNCSIDDEVYVGPGAIFMCLNAAIHIGSHVSMGPNVTIVTGDHRYDIVGKYITEITEKDKLPENDKPVAIEGDNWIGANVVILKGVQIGKGAIIAAGAVVTKNVERYSIVGGVPAKKIGMRFSDEQIDEHEKLLYNADNEAEAPK